MNTISLMKNKIQDYKWGSLTDIPQLLGIKPCDTPYAELWMGAHPKASSDVYVENQWKPLYKLVKDNPVKVLGKDIAETFNNSFPFLFKILAAARPLSIQAHPTKEQAVKGFERENKQKIQFNAPNRNYKDDNHKPECICAISPFWALNGFRPAKEILVLTGKINSQKLNEIVNILKRSPDSMGLKQFFNTLMTLDNNTKNSIINKAVKYAESNPGPESNPDPVFCWIIKLFQAYPSDIGVLSPLFLNLICLNPGQAMFLPAGQLHSYLEGLGLELMANSDNVLRGGLTPKHIDVPELLNTLDFTFRNIDILEPEPVNKYERIYKTNAQEFQLSCISVKHEQNEIELGNPGIQILLCVSGKIRIRENDNIMEIKKGESVLVPKSVGNYCIRGNGIIYKASVP